MHITYILSGTYSRKEKVITWAGQCDPLHNSIKDFSIFYNCKCSVKSGNGLQKIINAT